MGRCCPLPNSLFSSNIKGNTGIELPGNDGNNVVPDNGISNRVLDALVLLLFSTTSTSQRDYQLCPGHQLPRFMRQILIRQGLARSQALSQVLGMV